MTDTQVTDAITRLIRFSSPGGHSCLRVTAGLRLLVVKATADGVTDSTPIDISEEEVDEEVRRMRSMLPEGSFPKCSPAA